LNRQGRGSALVVVLVLLSALGALALAAAAAAMTALALAGHQQMAQNAFEAAEAGIVNALLAATDARRDGTHTATILPDLATARAEYRTETREAEGPGTLPAGFSIGENAGTFTARHFFITADADSGRGARARLEQGFYFVVPAS
jgi:type II secretory pathway component PulK